MVVVNVRAVISPFGIVKIVACLCGLMGNQTGAKFYNDRYNFAVTVGVMILLWSLVTLLLHLFSVTAKCQPETVRTMDRMASMMENGLSNDTATAEKSSLKMLPSYVCSLPDGSETGDHLALDLGGTNFRALVVTLKPERKAAQDGKIYVISHQLQEGSGENLFDHIAECLIKFVTEKNLRGKRLDLGFTFSFPCRQEGLTVSKLIKWTKGYCASGVEGEDVVRLLHEAIKRKRGDDLDVVAVLNDTVGTLMALAHEDQNCLVGVILGTGTNACYMEAASRAPKLQAELGKSGFDQMVVNMEWGAFGDKGELDDLRAEFDLDLDNNSINPKEQIFEKMISGMYIGELVRLALVELVKRKLIFGGEEWDELKKAHRFFGHYVSEIATRAKAHAAGAQTFHKIRDVLKDFGAKEPTNTDCVNVAYVCSTVVRRSAMLCAAGIAAILNRLEKPKVTVGIDGSVYRFNQPHFHDILCEKISSLLTRPCEFKIKLSTDGSGRGAAIVAAVAARLAREGKVLPKPAEPKKEASACAML